MAWNGHLLSCICNPKNNREKKTNGDGFPLMRGVERMCVAVGMHVCTDMLGGLCVCIFVFIKLKLII